MVRRRIPPTPVKACIYCVTPKQIVIVAHCPAGEQSFSFRECLLEDIDIICRACKDAEIRCPQVGHAGFPADRQRLPDIVERFTRAAGNAMQLRAKCECLAFEPPRLEFARTLQRRAGMLPGTVPLGEIVQAVPGGMMSDG